jgi:protein phosphatase 1L
LKAVEITVDHKPDNPVEKQFIEVNGGSVIMTGSTARVDGVLAISRSVGVRALRPSVRNEPDFFFYSFSGLPFRRLVLATDGVWDVLSVQEVAELETAQSILDQAIASGARDNIAVVVLEIGS